MTTTPHLDTHLNLPGLKALAEYLVGQLGASLISHTLENRELTLHVVRDEIANVLLLLRDDRRCRFTQLMDVAGVDWLGHRPAAERFAVVYHLLSLSQNLRIRVVVRTGEGPDFAAGLPNPLAEPVPSVVGIFPAAGWYEREAFDLFGIPFAGHPDLRRILTDYSFDGFPLRKDFPLEGKVEVYFDAAQNRVAYKPVDLPQEFRHFDRTSPWEGMQGNAGLAEADKPLNRDTFSREEFK